MKYHIFMDAEEIHAAIEEAHGNEVEELVLYIDIDVKKNKAVVVRKKLIGEYIEQYIKDI